MTNQDIETFFAVLDHGTMTAAAEALYITQPSLSARLKSLEDQVGAPLFHRGKGQRRITLTDAGQHFLPLARRWQNLLSETQCLTLGGGFGAGAGTGELCGAVTGAVMVLDLLTPADPADVVGSKKKAMAQAKELQKRFAERFDALRCADLLQKKFVPDDATPAAKALGLTGHCDIMIATAVEIVEQMIAER